MNLLREEFEKRLQALNETSSGAGRGRGYVGGFKGVRSSWEDIIKSLNYDYLNRSTHYRGDKIEPYNFNNYYSLDIRIKVENLLTVWEAGGKDYQFIFDNLYTNGQMEENLKDAFFQAYTAYYDTFVIKKLKADKPVVVNVPPPPPHSAWMDGTLDHLREDQNQEYVYDMMPIVSIYNDTKSQKESLAIKQDEFIPFMMDGLASAAHGHIPQGLTIEEILDGKFSRKAIAPEQGTFINRVKDPTSDKPFSFRAQQPQTMKNLHEIMLTTFKTDPSLKMKKLPDLNQSFAPGMTRDKLFLYMTQDDFHRLEKGGQGFSNLAKGILKDMSTTAVIPKLG